MRRRSLFPAFFLLLMVFSARAERPVNGAEMRKVLGRFFGFNFEGSDETALILNLEGSELPLPCEIRAAVKADGLEVRFRRQSLIQSILTLPDGLQYVINQSADYSPYYDERLTIEHPGTFRMVIQRKGPFTSPGEGLHYEYRVRLWNLLALSGEAEFFDEGFKLPARAEHLKLDTGPFTREIAFEKNGFVYGFYIDESAPKIWGPRKVDRDFPWQEARDFCYSLNKTDKAGQPNPFYSEENREDYLGPLASNENFRWRLPSQDDFLRAAGNSDSSSNLQMARYLPTLSGHWFWVDSSEPAVAFSGHDGRFYGEDWAHLHSVLCVGSGL